MQESLRPNTTDLQASSDASSEAIMAESLPSTLADEVAERLSAPPFKDEFVAVRSSGTDEDSATHSFAGEFSFTRGTGEEWNWARKMDSVRKVSRSSIKSSVRWGTRMIHTVVEVPWNPSSA